MLPIAFSKLNCRLWLHHWSSETKLKRETSLNYASRYNNCMQRLSLVQWAIPVKGCRGIKVLPWTSNYGIAFWASEVEAVHFRFSHSRHAALCFCSSETPRVLPSENHCSSLAASPSIVHVSSVSQLYVACVLRQSKGSAHVCQDWETTFCLSESILEIDVLGIETSLSVNLKSSSLVSEKAQQEKTVSVFRPDFSNYFYSSIQGKIALWYDDYVTEKQFVAD